MNHRPYRLIIDPGHGGKDPGAISRDRKVKEKDVNLAVSKSFVRIVRRGDYLFEAYPTRRIDGFISLFARCEIAKLWSVHAFLSVHCNARHQKGRDGIEIEVFHYPNSRLGREYANIVLGYLLSEIGSKTKVISRGVKEKKFYVLKHTPCPAILAELGFISDPEEAKFLANKRNQRAFAKALAEGTEIFLEGGKI